MEIGPRWAGGTSRFPSTREVAMVETGSGLGSIGVCAEAIPLPFVCLWTDGGTLSVWI
jgi:hypothetical protein